MTLPTYWQSNGKSRPGMEVEGGVPDLHAQPAYAKVPNRHRDFLPSAAAAAHAASKDGPERRCRYIRRRRERFRSVVADLLRGVGFRRPHHALGVRKFLQ